MSNILLRSLSYLGKIKHCGHYFTYEKQQPTSPVHPARPAPANTWRVIVTAVVPILPRKMKQCGLQKTYEEKKATRIRNE